MNAKLEAYLKNKWAEEREERELLLLKLGLYDGYIPPTTNPRLNTTTARAKGKTPGISNAFPLKSRMENRGNPQIQS